MKKNKAFTLVELMVVIVIIGVLAALAIPRFLGATDKAKASEFKPVLKQIFTLEDAYKQEREVYGALNQIGYEVPVGSSRFAYTLAGNGGTTFIASASLRANSIRTFTGTATINELGAGGVSDGLATITTWTGL